MRINHLDGLRGIAILWVILFHAYARWPEYLNFVQNTQDISIFQYGYLGVELFFMISGFVIFMTLDKAHNFIDFMKKRWLRLFPAMLIASLLIFGTAIFFIERPNGTPELINLIPGLTFISPGILHALTGLEIKSLEGAFWSLYVEVIFYAVIGFIYFIVGRKYCISMLFLLLVFTTFAYLIKNIVPQAYAVLSMFGFQHYAWFIIGCIIFEIINNRNSTLNNIIFIFSLIFCLYMQVSADPHFIQILFYNFIIIFIFITSFYSQQVQKILSTKLLLIIGFVSYPLYLIHENFLIAMLIKLQHFVPKLVMQIMPIFVSILLIGIAYLISKFLEPKVSLILKKIINKKTAQ